MTSKTSSEEEDNENKVRRNWFWIARHLNSILLSPSLIYVLLENKAVLTVSSLREVEATDIDGLRDEIRHVETEMEVSETESPDSEVCTFKWNSTL